MNKITMTEDSALERAALIAQQDADAPKLTDRLDAEAMRVLVEHVEALRAALADERKHADELAQAYRQVMPGCALIERHDARRAKEADNG